MTKTKITSFLDWKGIQFLLFTFKEFGRNKCSETAYFLSYTTLLSFVPMLAIIVMVLSYSEILQPAREQFYIYLYNDVIPNSGEQLQKYLSEFIEKSASVGVVGVVALIYTCMSMLVKIEISFNGIWGCTIINHDEEKLPFFYKLLAVIRTFLRHMLIIITVPIILAIAFTFSSAIQGLAKVDFGSLFAFLRLNIDINLDLSFINSPMGVLATQALSFAITSLGFGIMYWFIPRIKVPFKNAVIAGVMTAILFTLLKIVFAYVITTFTSYSAVYGAFAVLPSFMIYLSLSWSVILLGVQVSYCLTNFKHIR
ncbi:MAG: YihY family inner membrane protein [Moraxellaceae bacterium]|nr:YihY family inner membrane protein [Moraxellaceae bacterium]